MSSGRQQLLDWIDRDRDDLVRFLQAFVQHKSPNPPGDTRGTAALHHQVPGAAGPPVSHHLAASRDAEHRRQLRLRRRRTASRPQRPHRRVSRRRRRCRLDQGPLGRRDRRRQDLRPRRCRHEGRHHGLDLHLCLSASAQRPAQRQADADRGLRRGDVRALRRPLSHGASPGGARRRAAERRAVEPLQRALRREGAALARDHGQHARRARRLYACQQERDQDRDGDRRRAREAGRDQAAALRQRAHAPSTPGAPPWIAPWARAPAPSSTR